MSQDVPPLFKYLNEAGIDLLENCRIKVTPPNQFNDPFEFQPVFCGRLPRRHVKQTVNDKREPRQQYDWDKATGKTDLTWKDFKKLRKDAFKGTIAVQADNVSKMLAEGSQSMVNKLSCLIGVVCFTEKPDNFLMWAHYTNGHKGFVVEFDTHGDVFRNNKHFSKVNYSPKRPEIKLTSAISKTLEDDGWRTLITKSKEWEGEDEWRMSIPLTKTTEENGIRFAKVGPSVIKRVILGVRAPKDLQAKIKKVLSRTEYNNVVLEQAVLHEAEYRITTTPIRK